MSIYQKQYTINTEMSKDMWLHKYKVLNKQDIELVLYTGA